ncbi:HlyD family type I secretion periplasmic adaptor subunit [Aestuariivirga litoralis]|uniref:HlyD family type I secretion periplasmic adaptor subunit n=1 Tax=Aestuariivirga litoralis TaxID=2650924 RepID=UPI0018C56D10|nr:HlyD family type I secretion periplasmic adaptor subunit [Aestuariivirga litoralis]MBG1233593.1 HlyD family type I secretion periplasmic adaptor subunit [Aestuariivirga litoralis]
MSQIEMSKDTDADLRRLTLLGFAGIASMLGLFLAWTWFSDLNGAVVAQATIQAETYSKRIQHREGGNVLKILVKDGDSVTAGQELVLLDPAAIQSQVGIFSARLDELTVKRSALEAQRDGLASLTLPPAYQARAHEPALAAIISGQQRLLQSTLDSARDRQAQLNAQTDQINEQIKGHEAQMAADQTQLSLITSESDSLKPLQEKGLIPATRVLALERESARIAGEIGQLQASKASSLEKISEIKTQSLQIGEELRNQALNELRDTESKLSDAQGQLAASQSELDHTTIRAPIAGTVFQLTVHTDGGVITPGETLMMILPKDDALVLQAAVSPNDISHIHLGQQAELVFPAFDSRATPRIEAEVTNVAADTTRPDVSRGDAQAQPFYAVRLVISASERLKLGTNQLKPGMMAEAFIQTEARSPMSYLLKPLLQQWNHAMREH